jgi:RNA polymerase sigma factor (sigma-70 family)
MRIFANKKQPAAEHADVLTPLMQRIQQQDQAALGELYDLMLPKVYGLVLRIVTTHADAEEVTCDVFHQLWQRARQFDCKRGNPSQWIMVIARSRALDRYRERRQLRHEVHLPEAVDSYSITEQPDTDVASLHEFTVHQAIAALTPIQAELVMLAFFQGLTHQEIAETKQLPLGTVKSHLNRASATLRKTLSAADLK